MKLTNQSPVIFHSVSFEQIMILLDQFAIPTIAEESEGLIWKRPAWIIAMIEYADIPPDVIIEEVTVP